MKSFLILAAAILLGGCGDIDRFNRELVETYKKDCQSRGYSRVKVTMLFGLVSNYYKCID